MLLLTAIISLLAEAAVIVDRTAFHCSCVLSSTTIYCYAGTCNKVQRNTSLRNTFKLLLKHDSVSSWIINIGQWKV